LTQSFRLICETETTGTEVCQFICKFLAGRGTKKEPPFRRLSMPLIDSNILLENTLKIL
jgi:hypothetical protein